MPAEIIPYPLAKNNPQFALFRLSRRSRAGSHFGFLSSPFLPHRLTASGAKKGAFSFGNYGLSEKCKERVSNRFAVQTLPCRGHHSATLRGFPWTLSGLRPRSTHAQKRYGPRFDHALKLIQPTISPPPKTNGPTFVPRPKTIRPTF